jgi:hypothetical protein
MLPQADSPAHEEDGAGELFDGGQEFLDRMAIALGGKSIVPAAGGWDTLRCWFVVRMHSSPGCISLLAPIQLDLRVGFVSCLLHAAHALCFPDLVDWHSHAQLAFCLSP